MGMVTGSGNTAIHQFFSYDSSGNVVSVDYSSNGGGTFTTYYYLRNAQNDIVKIIDGNGNTVVEYKYDSWGKVLSTTGSLASTLGTNQPFRYRGYVYDAETGWYYLQSRYYDPSIGRFVSADVLLSTGQGVIGHNSYAYCGNNPIARTDSTGYAWWHWVIAAAVVAVAAVAVVATAGGAAAAVCAVTMVANGAAAATTASTVAAGVFIGSSMGFAAATMSSIATSGSVDDFMDNGDWYTVAGTMTGGLLGGVNAYNLRPRNNPRVVPQEAEDTYDYVQAHNGSPRYGYKGGRIYRNDGSDGSQILPNDTHYREYDIYPHVKHIDRGVERIVIGANGSAWYTYDHYKSFIQFR